MHASQLNYGLVFLRTYDTPGRSLWGSMLKRRSAKNFTWSISRPPRVVSRSTIGSPSDPPVLCR